MSFSLAISMLLFCLGFQQWFPGNLNPLTPWNSRSLFFLKCFCLFPFVLFFIRLFFSSPAFILIYGQFESLVITGIEKFLLFGKKAKLFIFFCTCCSCHTLAFLDFTSHPYCSLSTLSNLVFPLPSSCVSNVQFVGAWCLVNFI